MIFDKSSIINSMSGYVREFHSQLRPVGHGDIKAEFRGDLDIFIISVLVLILYHLMRIHVEVDVDPDESAPIGVEEVKGMTL